MNPDEDPRARFLSIASHDLRGALANVRSHAGLLLDPRQGLEGRARRSAEAIVRNTDRALDLLIEYFADQRAKIGVVRLLPERQSALELLNDALQKAQVCATRADVTLETRLPAQGVTASFDPDAFSRSVTAFLEHGIARARPGNRVRVVVEGSSKGIRVAVTDDEAFNADPHLYFDSLARALAEGKLGPGFRIAVAKAEIEAQGGSAGIEVHDGQTTAFFVLPP